MLRVYRQQLVGPVPQFPRAIEERIDQYLVVQAALKAEHDKPQVPAFDDALIAPPRLQWSAIKWRRNAEAPPR